MDIRTFRIHPKDRYEITDKQIGYTLNDKNQRTGIILADGKNWNFSWRRSKTKGPKIINAVEMISVFMSDNGKIYCGDLIG